MRRFFLFLVIWLIPGLAGAQTPTYDRLAALLDRAGCLDHPQRYYADLTSDGSWLLASAFTGDSLVALGRATGWTDIESFLNTGGTLRGTGDGPVYAEALLAANPGAMTRLEEEFSRYGSDLCPYIQPLLTADLTEVAQRQIHDRPYWQVLSRTAQEALNLRGCGRVEADGLFGPASQNAWARSGLPLSLGGLPSPGDLVSLAQAPRACRTGPLPETVALVADCVRPGAHFRTELGDIRQALGEGALPALLPSLRGCWFDGLTLEQSTDVLAVLAPSGRDLGALAPAAAEVADALLSDRYPDALYSAEPVLEAGVTLMGPDGASPTAGFGLALTLEALSRGAMQRVDMAVIRSVEASNLPDADKARALGALRRAFLDRLDAVAFRDVPAQINLLRMEAVLPIEAVALYLDLVTVLPSDPELAAQARAEGRPDVNYFVGTLILEGHAGLPRDFDLARTHLRIAADQGHAPAQYRLGRMLQFGQGHAPDPSAARAWMESAADTGETAALVFLAKADEGNPRSWPAAEAAYRLALDNLIIRDQFGVDGPRSAAQLIRDRLLAQSAFWAAGGPGAAILDGIAQTLDRAPTEDYDPAYAQLQEFAGALGDVYADTWSGVLLDLDQAAMWWRRGGQADKLAQLALSDPELLRDPASQDLLNGALRHTWAMRPDPSSFMAGFDRDCPVYGPEALNGAADMGGYFLADYDWAERYRTCVEFARDAAIGMISDDLIRPAIDWLETRAAAEWTALAEIPSLEASVVPVSTLALTDVRAFFGDYAAARGTLEHVHRVRIVPATYAEHFVWKSDRTVARQLAVVKSGDPEMADRLRGYLAALAARGHPTAGQMLVALESAETAAAPATDRAVLEARLARLEPLGPSRAYARTARELAIVSALRGDASLAVEYHLGALNADLDRAAAMARLDGPLSATMTQVCALSRTAEALFGLDQRVLALSLVKDAVNALQGVRTTLAGLPEDLRLCFRDQVAGHYRWLADLLIAEGRSGEASQVLQMLKEFELFQFTAHAEDQVRGSFELLPVSQADETLVSIARSVTPPAHAVALRRDVLRRKQQGAELSAAERAELDGLEAELAGYAQAREARRAALSDAAEAAGRADAAPRIAPGRSIKRFLRGVDGNAAVLQYVVLPDRIGAVLTTATTQTVHTWDSLDGAPMTEAALNDLIARYRDVLQSPDIDAAPTASRLGAAVISGEILAELEAADIDTLFVAPDRQLRYVPFAALHDGTGWMAERFSLIQATSAGVAAAGDRADRVAAFGTTQGWGFAPLPGVADEVNAIVAEGAGDPGLMAGAAHLDAGFTLDALVDALVFSDLDAYHMGVVHLATHFKLGANEADSFLLLGDGSRLSLETVRTGFGVDMDFSEVAVLTLSACETAFGTTRADGRELESFAAIAQDLGAQSVLASLWPISDQSTAWIMERTYARYVDGATLAQALAATQRELLGLTGTDLATATLFGEGTGPSPRWAHPYYWAPFTVLEGAV